MLGVLPDLAVLGKGATLGEQVYERLREALLSGALTPGQNLNTRALAASLNVSLTPTRDGLARLISEGVLELGPNRVVSVPVPTFQEISEVFNLRVLIECELAGSALERISARQISTLEKIQSDVLGALDSREYKEVTRQNFRFHFSLYSIAQLPITYKFAENLWLRVGPLLNSLYPQFDRNRMGVKNHNSILDCLRRHDEAELRRAVANDILGARDELLRVYEHVSS